MTAHDREDPASGGSPGESPDLLRDLILGLAGQIDNLASLFAPSGDGAGLAEHDLSADIGALLGELGELLARLLATLIAVLEAIVKALRGAPADPAAATRAHYQPIAVRVQSAPGTV